MSEHIYSHRELFELILPLLQKYHAESALLFGSYARQEATPLSDIDLLVIGGPGFDPTDIFCIAEELYGLTQKNVDVYELREINQGSDFYRTVLSEGVRVA